MTGDVINDETLVKINAFTRKELSSDEVFTFSIVLCDNEIDRDKERFSIEALHTLSKLFIGKTGIFDHNPKGSNQSARIYSTEIKIDKTRKTTFGEDYTYLLGYAYMVKTDSNTDLRKEIDGGIKKEVSVSCSVQKTLCSICENDVNVQACCHRKGSLYHDEICHHILEEPTDAYEWSFVAIPAQVNAGVTKKFGDGKRLENDEVIIKSSELNRLKSLVKEKSVTEENIAKEIRGEIIKLAFLSHPEVSTKTLSTLINLMKIDDLISYRNNLRKDFSSCEQSQIFQKSEENNDNYCL